jgi:hypothetical protein
MKEAEIFLHHELSSQVAELYRDMEAAYDQTAGALGFSCSGCPDNCCDSYFLHHTYTERLSEKAAGYVVASEAALARGERPVIMCPLNLDGLCALYPYRLMICRLHGVPSSMTRPDGRKLNFPGCFRCQEEVKKDDSVPFLDRTGFFKRLVDLELKLLAKRRAAAPKVKLTIAQMIVMGPPFS